MKKILALIVSLTFISCLKNKMDSSDSGLALAGASSKEGSPAYLLFLSLEYYSCQIVNEKGKSEDGLCYKEDGRVYTEVSEKEEEKDFGLAIKFNKKAKVTSELKNEGNFEALPLDDLFSSSFSRRIYGPTSTVSKLQPMAYRFLEDPYVQFFRELPEDYREVNYSPSGVTRRVVMDEGSNRHFHNYVHQLDQKIQLEMRRGDHEKAEIYRKELTKLGRIRKEMEYSLENQAHRMRLWKFDIEASEVETSVKEEMNSLLEEAIQARNPAIFYENFKESWRLDFLSTLKKKKFVAISRPVEDVGLGNIALGFDGKSVNMKEKSSTVTGFIPVQQVMSKLPNRYLKKLEEGGDTSIKAMIKELKKYQGKSEEGFSTIESNFLPTSVGKPYVKMEPMVMADGTLLDAGFRIGVLPNLNLESLTEANFAEELKKIKGGEVQFQTLGELFSNYDPVKMRMALAEGKGQDYVAQLIQEGQFKADVTVLRHHANPATFEVEGFETEELLEEFKAQQLEEFKEYLSGETEGFSYGDYTEENFFENLGREAYQRLRFRYNSTREIPLEKEFAQFVIRKQKGDESYRASDAEIESFYMRTKEISADNDTWGKGSPSMLGLHNFFYNTHFSKSMSFEEFEKLQSLSDRFDVFPLYPPGVLESFPEFTRLTKHFFEQHNTAFPQRLLDDYPLSIQVLVGENVEIKVIEKGPDGNPHGPFLQQLESFAEEGIYFPLNPMDVISNFDDYAEGLKSSPHLSRFVLKYVDDFAREAPEGAKLSDFVKVMRLGTKKEPNFSDMKAHLRELSETLFDNVQKAVVEGSYKIDESLLDLGDLKLRLDFFLSYLWSQDWKKRRILSSEPAKAA